MTDVHADEGYLFESMLRLSKQMSHTFERCTGISPSRLRLLCKLFQVDEISQTALQKEVSIDGAAITRHLKQLEASGVVIRRNNPEDNRVSLVQLSDLGRKQLIALEEEKKKFITQLLTGFDEQERAAFTTMVNRMLDNIHDIY